MPSLFSSRSALRIHQCGQRHIGHFLSRRLFDDIRFAALEQVSNHRQVHNGPGQEHHRHLWIDLAERPFFLPRGNVPPQKIEHRQPETFPEQSGHQMAFQARKQNQSVKRRIFPERLQNRRRNISDQARIIALIGKFPERPDEFRRAFLIRFRVEDGVIQIFLAGEMPKQDCFADARGRRDVTCLRAAEALPCEYVDSHLQKLFAAVLPVHAVTERERGTAGGARYGLGHK